LAAQLVCPLSLRVGVRLNASWVGGWPAHSNFGDGGAYSAYQPSCRFGHHKLRCTTFWLPSGSNRRYFDKRLARPHICHFVAVLRALFEFNYYIHCKIERRSRLATTSSPKTRTRERRLQHCDTVREELVVLCWLELYHSLLLTERARMLIGETY